MAIRSPEPLTDSLSPATTPEDHWTRTERGVSSWLKHRLPDVICGEMPATGEGSGQSIASMENLIQSSRRTLCPAKIRRLTLSLVALVALGFSAGSALAGVEFHTNSTAFGAAASSFSLMGTENWSSAGNAAEAAVADPLAPGVANGPFPNGSSVAAGVRVQSNILGNTATNASPGNGALFYTPTGFTGASGNKQPSNQVTVNFANESMDVIFSAVAGSTPRAVSLTPLFFRLGLNNSATVTIQVYNQTNAFLGSTMVSNVQDCLETAYLGITTTGSDSLGRINLWATSTDIVGVDNLSVYGSAGVGPRLRALQLTQSGFSVQLDAEAGQTFRILASTNLTSWLPVQTNTLSTASQQLLLPTSGSARFYRAEQLP